MGFCFVLVFLTGVLRPTSLQPGSAVNTTTPASLLVPAAMLRESPSGKASPFVWLRLGTPEMGQPSCHQLGPGCSSAGGLLKTDRRSSSGGKDSGSDRVIDCVNIVVPVGWLCVQKHFSVAGCDCF